MDFTKLQQTLFEIEPTDPREDLAKLKGETVSPVGNTEPTVNYLEESVEVPEGSMPTGVDSIADFVALAGIRLDERAAQKDGDYARGDRPTPKKGSGAKRSPDEGKLVGEEDNFIQRGVRNAQSGVLAPDSVEKKIKSVVTPGSGGNTKTKLKPKPTNKPKPHGYQISDKEYKAFLDQHNDALRAITSDPRKKAQFDSFMTKMGEGMEEMAKKKSPPVERNPHSKDLDALRTSGAGGAHMNKAKRDSNPRKMKHKGKAFAEESIKEMLLRKLNEKNGNT
jgi:hypothetical protein